MIRIINWEHNPIAVSWVGIKKVNSILKEWEKAAMEKLIKSEADHVVYGYKKYFIDKYENETFELNLMITPLSDEEFYKRTSGFGTDYLIYALHKGTNYIRKEY